MVKMVGAEMIERLKRAAVPHEVDILFPKFEMTCHVRVKDVLSKMGVKAVFNKSQADLEGMVAKSSEGFRVYINEIYHDAWIDVHEEGTEAAAATSTIHYGCSAPPKPMHAEFHADHPFLFLIVHNESRSILFAGWVSDPRELF